MAPKSSSRPGFELGDKSPISFKSYTNIVIFREIKKGQANFFLNFLSCGSKWAFSPLYVISDGFRLFWVESNGMYVVELMQQLKTCRKPVASTFIHVSDLLQHFLTRY